MSDDKVDAVTLIEVSRYPMEANALLRGTSRHQIVGDLLAELERMKNTRWAPAATVSPDNDMVRRVREAMFVQDVQPVQPRLTLIQGGLSDKNDTDMPTE